MIVSFYYSHWTDQSRLEFHWLWQSCLTLGPCLFIICKSPKLMVFVSKVSSAHIRFRVYTWLLFPLLDIYLLTIVLFPLYLCVFSESACVNRTHTNYQWFIVRKSAIISVISNFPVHIPFIYLYKYILHLADLISAISIDAGHWKNSVQRWPASKQASKQASKPDSQPTGQPANRPTDTNHIYAAHQRQWRSINWAQRFLQ